MIKFDEKQMKRITNVILAKIFNQQQCIDHVRLIYQEFYRWMWLLIEQWALDLDDLSQYSNGQLLRLPRECVTRKVDSIWLKNVHGSYINDASLSAIYIKLLRIDFLRFICASISAADTFNVKMFSCIKNYVQIEKLR